MKEIGEGDMKERGEETGMSEIEGAPEISGLPSQGRSCRYCGTTILQKLDQKLLAPIESSL